MILFNPWLYWKMYSRWETIGLHTGNTPWGLGSLSKCFDVHLNCWSWHLPLCGEVILGHMHLFPLWTHFRQIPWAGKGDCWNFVKLTFVKGSTGSGMVNCGSTTGHKRNWSKLITHRSWRKHTARLQGPRRRSRQGAERTAGPGAHAFTRVLGWSALRFWG